jgi:prepilin-type N-terminal cleavage/methylation domain-containing protein
MARLFRKLGESEGFTLIEVLVVVAVLSVGLAAIAFA